MAYQSAFSLRFGTNRYLNITPAAGTQDRWKMRLAVKRAALGSEQTIVSAGASSPDRIYFDASDRLCWDFAGTTRLVSTPVFRDPTAFLTFEFIYDAANGSAAQRARVLVSEGGRPLAEITAWSTDTRSSIASGSGKFNTNVVHNIGRNAASGSSYFEGYMDDVALIDNSATDSFSGQLNAVTGTWDPIAPVSPKWWLKFDANSTVSALGTDSGSDGASWTANNFSVTAGANNDSLTDTPMNYGTDTGAGGEARGNYATLTPLNGSAPAISNGNLSTSGSNTGNNCRVAAFDLSPTKFYFEGTFTISADGNDAALGILSASRDPAGTWPGQNADDYSLYCLSSGGNVSVDKRTNGGNTALTTGTGLTHTVGVAVDIAAGKIWFRLNGTWLGSGDPATGTNPTFSGITNKPYYPAVFGSGGPGTTTWNLNFGQRPFANAAPSGFKALCTQNLPDPIIKRGDDYFAANTRTGNGSSFSVSGKRFQPDLVWIKSRSAATDHALYDSSRGVQKQLESNNTDAETTETTGLTAFGSDGFSGGALAQINTNAASYVDWLWKRGAPQGLDIVSYTGNGLAGRSVSHSLGAVPKFWFIKNRSATANWVTYTTVIDGSVDFLDINLTSAKGEAGETAPTSSLFYPPNSGEGNTNGHNYIAYLFAEIPGFSRIGIYSGNGSAHGPFVWCGFRPRWIVIKRTDSTGDWYVWDAARNTINPLSAALLINSSAAEVVNADLDALSNGYKIRATTAGFNAAGGTYLFAAFAEHPFKYSAASEFAVGGFDMSSMGMFCLP